MFIGDDLSFSERIDDITQSAYVLFIVTRLMYLIDRPVLGYCTNLSVSRFLQQLIWEKYPNPLFRFGFRTI